MKKRLSILMLLALIVPLYTSPMGTQENGDEENLDQENNVEVNDEEIAEDEEPAPQPNPDRLAQMRAIQERARRFAQRFAQNNRQENQFEHECPICREAEATIQLPCNHRMCQECLTNWTTTQGIPNLFQVRIRIQTGQPVRQATTCPECRADIPEAFIHQELTNNITKAQKVQLRLSLLGKGFLNGLFWGSTCKKILQWWRSPYLEKSADLGNTVYSFGCSILIHMMLQGQRFMNEMVEAELNHDPERNLNILLDHGKQIMTINQFMKTGLILKTKNKSLIHRTLHSNMLFPSLAVAESAIPYMNKGYAYKLCSRTAYKGWNAVGTCLGLYCTNRIYNAYNNWGSRMLTRAGITA